MDESGLLSGIVLAAALLAYASVSLRQSLSGAAPGSVREPLLGSVARLGATVAVTVAAAALFFSISWMTPPLAALFALLLLATLVGVGRLAGYLADRRPSLAAFLSAPFRWLPEGGKGEGAALELGSVMTPGEETDLDDKERSMIRAVLQLDDYNARDIMVPRVDVVSVDVEDDVSKVVDRMLESGHSRLPVYKDTIDNVVGVIYSRRLTPLINTPPPWPPVQDLMLEPYFIPETKRLDELLAEFQRRRVEIALVVDEHGGTEGLVTLEDLLEEIVGEIEDEFSTYKSPPIMPTADGKLIVDAGISLNDLEEYVPIKFEELDVDTIGGLVYRSLGRMPKAGDEVVYRGIRIKALSIVGRRLRKLQLAPEPEPEPEAV